MQENRKLIPLGFGQSGTSFSIKIDYLHFNDQCWFSWTWVVSDKDYFSGYKKPRSSDSSVL